MFTTFTTFVTSLLPQLVLLLSLNLTSVFVIKELAFLFNKHHPTTKQSINQQTHFQETLHLPSKPQKTLSEKTLPLSDRA